MTRHFLLENNPEIKDFYKMILPSQQTLGGAGLVLHSSDIFGKSKFVLIRHHDQWYRLAITKQGKLILTK